MSGRLTSGGPGGHVCGAALRNFNAERTREYLLVLTFSCEFYFMLFDRNRFDSSIDWLLLSYHNSNTTDWPTLLTFAARGQIADADKKKPKKNKSKTTLLSKSKHQAIFYQEEYAMRNDVPTEGFVCSTAFLSGERSSELPHERRSTSRLGHRQWKAGESSPLPRGMYVRVVLHSFPARIFNICLCHVFGIWFIVAARRPTRSCSTGPQATHLFCRLIVTPQTDRPAIAADTARC